MYIVHLDKLFIFLCVCAGGARTNVLLFLIIYDR